MTPELDDYEAFERSLAEKMGISPEGWAMMKRAEAHLRPFQQPPASMAVTSTSVTVTPAAEPGNSRTLRSGARVVTYRRVEITAPEAATATRALSSGARVTTYVRQELEASTGPRQPVSEHRHGRTVRRRYV